MLELSTQHAQLRIAKNPIRLDVQFAQPSMPRVISGHVAVGWKRAGWPLSWEGALEDCEVSEPRTINSAHGPLKCGRIRGVTSGGEMKLEFTFALPREHPLALWKLAILPLGPDGLRLTEIDLLKVGRIPHSSPPDWWRWIWPGQADGPHGELEFASEIPELAWLSDGWQSWSFSGVVSDERIVTGTRLGPLTRPMYLNPGARRLPGRAWRNSEFFTVMADRRSRAGLLVGLLSERRTFGSLEGNLDPDSPALRLYANGDGAQLSPGERFATDWAALQPVELDAEDPMGPYVQAVARENEARVPSSPPVGWSSWYFYFEDVSSSDVQSNLDWARDHRRDLPLEVIQIDDGYQEMVGDWLRTETSFPGGMPQMAERINSAGFTPGIWMAPFAARPRARVVREHPDWLLRGRTGRPVRAGYNWGTFFVALDVTHPEVLDHLRQVIRTVVNDWGFRYLKFDFLYAGALAGRRHDPTLTRAQALRRALEVIREAAGEQTVLSGCGCPLGSGVGIFDTMRVGPDVAARWKPAYQGLEFFFEHETGLPSARNSIQNTLSRAGLNGRWWINDPDCLLLRSSNTHLSQYEVQSLLTVAALSGGSHLASEDLDRVDAERLEWLARMLPPVGRAARVVDWFDQARPQRLVLPMRGSLGKWWLVAVLNWDDRESIVPVRPERLGLQPRQRYVCFDLWRHSVTVHGGRSWPLKVPRHGVRLLRVQPEPSGPAWLGDSLHLSGGSPVVSWQVRARSVTAELDLGRLGHGEVWLALPSPPARATLDERLLEWEKVANGTFKVRLPEFDRARLLVAFGGGADRDRGSPERAEGSESV